MTSRINARLDDELARKLAELRRRTGRSTTEIVKASIEAYYEAERSRPRALELLADLIGAGDADPNLSTNYKAELTASLSKKHSLP